MTEEQIKRYLRNRGCPESVWQGGTKFLAQRWAKFVAEVEKEYCPDCLIQEYWNDLDVRELIHGIGRDGEVKDANKRFATMLTSTNIKHWCTDRKTDYDLWNDGYPKNATGFFLREVEQYVLRKA
jgi:hypothetical protein